MMVTPWEKKGEPLRLRVQKIKKTHREVKTSERKEKGDYQDSSKLHLKTVNPPRKKIFPSDKIIEHQGDIKQCRRPHEWRRPPPNNIGFVGFYGVVMCNDPRQ